MHFLPSQPKTTRYSSPSFQRNRLKRGTRALRKQNSSVSGNWHYWVIAQETCRIPYYTLASLRVLIRRIIKRELTEFRIYASFRVPVTSKPGIRMGTGKGKIRTWLTEYKKGQVLISFEEFDRKTSPHYVFRMLRYKLPISFKILRRRGDFQLSA